MSIEDRYPSRNVGTPTMIPRFDPVLHGGLDAAGPLTAEELEAFARDGYLTCRAVLEPGQIDELLAATSRNASATQVLEPDADVVRSLFAVHRGDGPLARILRDPCLTARARQILADDLTIHQSRVNLKPAFDGREFWWHSDFETWHVEDGMPGMRALSAMIMLTANTPANGPLLVIPGSHLAFVACVGETPADHHAASLRRQEYGVPDRTSISSLAAGRGVVAISGQPGDVVLFDCNLLHGSTGNLSPSPRCNLFAVYNALSNAPVTPFGKRPPRPDFVADRNATPILSGTAS
jgi:ectoine hydroxylase